MRVWMIRNQRLRLFILKVRLVLKVHKVFLGHKVRTVHLVQLDLVVLRVLKDHEV